MATYAEASPFDAATTSDRLDARLATTRELLANLERLRTLFSEHPNVPETLDLLRKVGI